MKKTTKKTVAILIILSLISKLLGLGKRLVQAYYYGTSGVSDAFLISQVIPSTLFMFLIKSIEASYIPMYNRIENDDGVSRADNYTNNLVNTLLLICIVITIIVVIFTHPIVYLFASGFEGETFELAVRFTRISVFVIFFTGLTSIFINYLQIKNKFLNSAFRIIIMDIILILIVILSYKININILATGGVIASLAALFPIMMQAKNQGYRYRFIINLKDEHIKQMLYMTIPIIIGTSVNEINTLIDRALASRITEGGISALSYANQMILLVPSICSASVLAIMYPKISKFAVANDICGVKELLSRTVISVSLLVTPSMIGIMCLSEPITRLLFMRGAFNETGLVMTASAIFFYTAGLLFIVLREIFTKSFYAINDTKTPAINAAISLVVNTVLSLALSKVMGINGLALATSIAATLCAILLFISLRRKIGSFGTKKILIALGKIFMVSIIMAVVVMSVHTLLEKYTGNNLSLVLAIITGVCVYCILICFLRIGEVDVILELLKNKLKAKFINKAYKS